MTDLTRAEITNSIWLCRNCHKLIDTDEQKYSANTLFLWREKHEEYIASTLGNNNDLTIQEEQISDLSEFKDYPPIIKRIIIDKPDGWEYRLTAELMRFLNEPLFRRLNDLKNGLYLKDAKYIESEKVLEWIQEQLAESSRIIKSAEGLLNSLTKSWGKLGEPGDIKEIHHTTILIKNYLEHAISFEEKVNFVNAPDKYQKIISLLKNLIGSQVEKFSAIPNDLDEFVLLAEKYPNETDSPIVIEKEIVFELPENWQKEFNKELYKLEKGSSSSTNKIGCLILTIIIYFIIKAIL